MTLVQHIEHAGYSELVLSNPAKANTLSLECLSELLGALESVEHAQAVVISALGKVFSAGHNFADMAGASVEQIRGVFELCTNVMLKIQNMPQPVIAKVNGIATAAGCQLVATCDLAIASTNSKFSLPGGKGGLFCTTPLVGVSRSISRKRALEFAMSGDYIDAPTAENWGLINKCVEESSLDVEIEALVARVTRGSWNAKALGKQAFYTQIDMPIEQAYNYAIEIMAQNAAGPDGQEGIMSFVEKREPQWNKR